MNNDKYLPRCIPQDDLDCYYNNKWKSMHKLSKHNSEINNFTLLQSKIDNEMYNFIRGLKEIKECGNCVQNEIVQLRESYDNRKDSATIILQLVRQIDTVSSIQDLANIISILTKLKIPTLFFMFVIPHFKAPDIYVLCIKELSLTLELKDAYNNHDNKIIKEYISFLSDVYDFVVKKWNYRKTDKNNYIQNILVFETVFSKTILDQDELNNPHIIFNSLSYMDFLNKFDYSNFWETILENYVDSNSYISYENTNFLVFFKKFLIGLDYSKLTMIKDYLILCLFREIGMFTSIYKSFNKIMQSIPTKKIIFVEMFYSTFGFFLESYYESKYSDINKIKYVYEMFINLKKYCMKTFQLSSIFQDSTKKEMIRKIDALDIIIGRQDYSLDLTFFPTLTGDFFDNVLKINLFYFNQMISFLNKPKKKHCISVNNDIFSFMINAYYDIQTNNIYIPTCILNEPFFNMSNDIISNYGSIGSIIGHEIMHCFDEQGCLFDYRGHLNNFWSQKDYMIYHNELNKIKKHYGSYMINEIKIDPYKYLSENFADIVGLKLSLRSYIDKYMPQLNINNLMLNEKEHLKKFFKFWAKNFRNVEEEEILLYSLESDEHAPNNIRINAPLSHLIEYYKVYDVLPYHQNYIDPSDRIQFMD